jgi:hypothetical protein
MKSTKRKKRKSARGGLKKRKKTKSAKKSKKISLLIKYHTVLTITVVFLYLTLGLAVDPKLLLTDISEKYAEAATSLTKLQLVIHGPPAQPVVSATPGCSSSSPYIVLAWDTTNDTDSYDITRDGDNLVTGLTVTTYQDNYVVATTSYTYQVTANGPYGSATSDEVSATTGDCYVPPNPAQCTIVTINKINLTNYSKIPKVTDRTPIFTGTANMAYAVMHYEIYSGPVIIASGKANSNGYWTYTVPTELNYGLHTIYVTATDPADPSRFFTATQNFRVEKEEAKTENEKETKTAAKTTALPATPNPSEAVPLPKEQNPPFNFNFSVESQDKLIYLGSDLLTNLEIIKLRDFPPEKDLLKYKITDVSGRTVSEWEKSVLVTAGANIKDDFKIPSDLHSGKYKITVETQTGKYLIVAENSFETRERPILNMGGGLIVTYPMVISILGYLMIFCLLLLFIFLALLGREYWLARQALRQIDEDKLAREGYIS